MSLRIGHGYDVHAFTEGDHLVLGGVRIPHDKSFKAHSDGDVLIHAVCDALLGAVALGDIGHHFPDTDEQYRGIDSRQLLRKMAALLQQQGWRVHNIDSTIIAQAPKLAPYIETMRTHLATDLNIEPGQINIKATTTEHLGHIGRKEGIAAHVVVLVTAL